MVRLLVARRKYPAISSLRHTAQRYKRSEGDALLVRDLGRLLREGQVCRLAGVIALSLVLLSKSALN